MTIRLYRLRLVAALACILAVTLGACSTWHPVSVAPGTAAGSTRVTLADGSRMTMVSHELRPDSLIGTTEAGSPVRAAAGDVQMLEVQRFSFPRTASLVVMHASALLTVIAVIVHVQPHYRGTF